MCKVVTKTTLGAQEHKAFCAVCGWHAESPERKEIIERDAKQHVKDTGHKVVIEVVNVVVLERI